MPHATEVRVAACKRDPSARQPRASAPLDKTPCASSTHPRIAWGSRGTAVMPPCAPSASSAESANDGRQVAPAMKPHARLAPGGKNGKHPWSQSRYSKCGPQPYSMKSPARYIIPPVETGKGCEAPSDIKRHMQCSTRQTSGAARADRGSRGACTGRPSTEPGLPSERVSLRPRKFGFCEK